MSKQVMVRDVAVGGGAPISIQSMTNADSRDEKGICEQVARLTDAGCDIIRIAVPDREAAEVFARVRRKTDKPLVADIHFDYRLAIEAIRAGADKIRINPGNIGDDDRVRKVVKAAKSAGIPIRVGVNSGSLEKDIVRKNGGVTAEGLAESALRNVKRLEDMDFDDIVVSMKASDVRMNYEAHRIAAARTEHPFHIGITEAGTVRRGKIKSAAGIGGLLLAGIGDTVRVSLTADPVEEVVFARELLESLGIRKSRYDLVSCPTCGRTGIDLESLAEEVDRRLSAMENLPSGLKVAVMGCAVNGPGEAAEADFGCCGGDGKGLIIAKGKVIATVAENELAEELIRVIRENGGV
ncbi:flavodoxin-dependent (E)-4-hydroxy-3-methylbut-2-enyl-diphosphate synthase [Hornefia butyriciproducens]|jgi:(E)-4-hydroxy-3-methylbut-2-enyl-diphosphate synthase|uniref:flavodoxin-dependent (E)-4-hydroxy-3-methylbut-2-enyl-diphosphate synthase n=1 Tax=Hornefia butyriciproducens TaxID=2652293 RepID=UPI0023F4E3E2|nr:flavodoxin-dependent (E)-4-hydroxy-3-methylbut-2-enyl-diphosphate synthase [Hornefia butyriciproducens]MCI7327884.1 flavodoxin-dependent (E)-4-hydroxy-3-methylbut-2-enyl-diphosphate synthase [Clostridiales bacterium]MDD6299864.1 flavodoxin-dependent (E)-4-hydroxy-3-methylbut-2-enyl-diphosphate synthase [Hornefia butyriciproducens]MDY2989938.1 flavodoxin-dependent (E)-4-hydroxy-3-methylbut-2-enyl-diphosphate synthase [Hornefia butyriciproducens]